MADKANDWRRVINLEYPGPQSVHLQELPSGKILCGEPFPFTGWTHYRPAEHGGIRYPGDQSYGREPHRLACPACWRVWDEE